MDRRERRRVDDRRGGRLDVGDQPGRVVVARLGEMDLVADPLPRGHPGALARVVGIGVVRRADEHGGRGDVVGRAPADCALLQPELLHPDAAQRLDRRDLAQPGGCLGAIDRRQQRVPVAPY
jgi:hypothetical protein